MIGRVTSDVNSVRTAAAAAYQTLYLTSELLVHENVNKRIDGGITSNQDDGSDVRDVTIVLRRAEVVQCIDC